MRSRTDEGSDSPERERSTDVSEAAARAALEQLLVDPEFHVSDRNRRFLRFVVEETLAGRRDRIKAYTIAVDVFGRSADFDSTIDPIVRIEATRLRAALNGYYAGPGRNAEIQVRLPKGGYVPLFERSGLPAPPVEAPRAETPPQIREVSDDLQSPPKPQPAPVQPRSSIAAHVRLALVALLVLLVSGVIIYALRNQTAPLASPPTIILEPVQAATFGEISDQISTGFMQSLTLALSRFDGISVVTLPRQLSLSTAVERLRESKGTLGTVYALESGARQDSELIRFWWKLKDAQDGETVWADIADQSFSKGMTIAVEDAVASKVATVIGQPQGLVAMRELAIERSYPASGYGCVLRARAYYLSIAETLHREVRDCLERTVAVAPDYADAWAMLSFVYLDEDRNKFNLKSTAEDAVNRAVKSAQRAAELAPTSETAQEALMAVYYRKGDFDIALAAGRRALEINPHNPELMSQLGVRLFARGEWDEGAALVRRAIDRALVVPPLDRVTIVLDEYRKHNYVAALAQAQLIDLPDYYAAPLLRAAIYGELGNRVEAQSSIKELLALRQNYAAEMRAELRSRHYTESLIDMLADGLGKAGLAVQ